MESQLSLEVQTTKMITTQEFTSDPDLLVVRLSPSFLTKAQRLVEFMNGEDNGVESMVTHDLELYLYDIADKEEPDSDVRTEVFKGDDNVSYVEHESSIRYTECITIIDRSGAVSVRIESGDDLGTFLTSDIGTVRELMNRFGMSPN